MTTYYLKLAEKVPLLENELKRETLIPLLPTRFAEGLGDWALGVGLCECV